MSRRPSATPSCWRSTPILPIARRTPSGCLPPPGSTRDDRTLVLPEHDDETRPFAPVAPETSANTTTEMPSPRSGHTQSFPRQPLPDALDDADEGEVPRRSASTPSHRPLWRRRPDLLVAAAVALSLMFVLGTIVSGGDDASGSGTSGSVPTVSSEAPATSVAESGTPGNGQQAPDQSQDPARRLNDALSQIEELGR